MSKWSKKKIKDFAFTASGGTPSTERKEYWHNGTIPWINSGELSKHDIIKKPTTYITQEALDNSSAKLFPIGTVVIALTGATTGMSAILEIETSTNQSITGIFPSKEHDSKFLLYTLHHNIDKILLHNVGSAQPHINKEIVDNLEFNYPIVPEQYVISKILSTADAVIEKTQAAIAKYKAIKQGMLQDLFTRGIDLNTNKLRPRYQEAPELYKEGKLGWIPREWEVEEIGNYSFVTKLAGFEYTLYFDYSKSGPIIAVRALNIKEGKLNLDNIHTIPQETSNYLTRSQLQKGDLVISYVGTVGEVAVIPESNKFHLAPNVAKISVDKNEVNPFYLNQFLNSHIGQKEIYKLIGATTQSALSMGNLRMVNFLKPEIEEQKEIYNRLQSIDNNIKTEQAYLQKMQNLKKGLMEDLLSGRKQVKINEATTV